MIRWLRWTSLEVGSQWFWCIQRIQPLRRCFLQLNSIYLLHLLRWSSPRCLFYHILPTSSNNVCCLSLRLYFRKMWFTALLKGSCKKGRNIWHERESMKIKHENNNLDADWRNVRELSCKNNVRYLLWFEVSPFMRYHFTTWWIFLGFFCGFEVWYFHDEVGKIVRYRDPWLVWFGEFH